MKLDGQPQTGRAFARLGDHRLAIVDTDDEAARIRALSHRAHVIPRAAADIENALGISEIIFEPLLVRLDRGLCADIVQKTNEVAWVRALIDAAELN